MDASCVLGRRHLLTVLADKGLGTEQPWTCLRWAVPRRSVWQRRLGRDGVQAFCGQVTREGWDGQCSACVLAACVLAAQGGLELGKGLSAAVSFLKKRSTGHVMSDILPSPPASMCKNK